MIEGPIEIGNLLLHALPINHHRRYWETHQQVVRTSVGKFYHIIPEYYPDEQLLAEKNNPLGNHIKELSATDNYLFQHVNLLCKQQKKDVWVIDPAYDEAFINFHGLVHIPTVATSFALAATSAHFLGEKIRQKQLFTKREILEGLILGSLALVFAGMTAALSVGAVVGPSRIPGPSVWMGRLEDDFRESQAVQHLIDLGAAFANPTEALLIYPPWHWERMKLLIYNEPERVKILNRYSWLNKFSLLQPLFKMRHYPEGIVQ